MHVYDLQLLEGHQLHSFLKHKQERTSPLFHELDDVLIRHETCITNRKNKVHDMVYLTITVGCERWV